MAAVTDEKDRIANIHLDEASVVRRSATVEHERKVAIYDLLEENTFKVLGDYDGPYELHLSIEENRLAFDIRDSEGVALTRFALPLSPFRKTIKDYFLICDSYYNAIKSSSPSQIEAIDMGRRGLHNEGSEMLKDRLADKVEIDIDTARRLFTLVCVLHLKQ
jgi:uncharacterized protein (UPF0262 family)